MPIIYAARNSHIETLRFLCMKEYDVEEILEDVGVRRWEDHFKQKKNVCRIDVFVRIDCIQITLLLD